MSALRSLMEVKRKTFAQCEFFAFRPISEFIGGRNRDDLSADLCLGVEPLRVDAASTSKRKSGARANAPTERAVQLRSSGRGA
jgi:hypothetical protein